MEEDTGHEARPDAEAMLDALLEHVPLGMGLLDAELRFVRVNAALAALNGRTPAEHLGRTVAEVSPAVAPDVAPLHRRALAGEVIRELSMSGTANGEWREWITSFFPVRAAAGEIVGVGVTVADVTERLAAERALRRSEERLRQMAEHIPLVFWLMSADATEYWYVSPAYERVWGRTVQSLADDPASFLDAVHPDDRERVLAAGALHPVDDYNVEYRIVRPDGGVAWVRDRSFPIHDGSGEMVAITGFAMDVTEAKDLEAQLRQAQKMEGLGRLAGGIAHDFNNMLTLIEGYGRLALDRLGRGADAADEVREMIQAGERAAELTRRLLTFSRRRPPVHGYAGVNDVVEEMERLLQRLIGEDIRVVTALGPGAGAVALDPGELGQVVMNLAVNARDAMPDGGLLTIETAAAEIRPGDLEARAGARTGGHAVLVVRDTGFGMSQHAVEHAFDPFFTTKPPGQGTGLGLATVYGIVERAGGHVALRSEPGRGTVVTVHLPRVEALAPAPAGDPPAGPPAAQPGETVLVAEDEPALRALVSLVLRERGYTVLEAGSGDEAVRVAARHDAPLDLLLTDVVMPGMGGPELAAVLRARQPGLRTIFVSGYPDRAEGASARLDSGEFVPKPFSPEELVRKVRHVLDQPPA